MRVQSVSSPDGRAAATAAPSTATRHVEPQRTPTSVAELRAALDRAYRKLNGRAPSAATLDVLTAQVSHETGRGQHMYNYNFGGIKGTGPSGATTAAMTSEVLSSGTVRLRQNFRAYDSLDQGALDYVAFMHAHYGAAVDQAAAGNLDGFAHALKRAGYYTASESDYAAALRANAGSAASETKHGSAPLAHMSAPSPADFSSSVEVARFVDLVARASARIVATEDDG